MSKGKIGLILTGGGARAAYQVGVLKAIAEALPRRANAPFQIISGTSAGSLNAVALAINPRSFRKATRYLLGIWNNARVHDIYRADAVGVFLNLFRWLAGLVLSVLGINRLKRVSLLDNAPLELFLDQTFPYENIQKHIDSGDLHALSIAGSDYGTGLSVTFFQGHETVQPWRYTHHVGKPTEIGIKHMLASSAIPLVFPAVRIDDTYYGDGSMRQFAPIGSALLMGAHKIMVLGTWHDNGDRRSHDDAYPSLAQIAGHALDSLFLDGLEVDLERLRGANSLIELIPEAEREANNLHPVDILVVAPSIPLETLAARYVQDLPWTIRLLLRALGVMRGAGSVFASYLLFERSYCRALIDLGYQDAMRQREEILRFLEVENFTPK